jgi:GcrA cell cycle regulator
MNAPSFDWTPAAVADLRRMRSEGIGINAIARHLGTSRGAVAGKALRLGLSEPRANPIAPLPAWKQAKVIGMLSAGKSIRETARVLRVSRETVTRIECQRQRGPVQVAPASVIEIYDAPRAPRRLDGATGPGLGIGMADAPRNACQWPLWGNERPTFRCCDAPSSPGRPYCAEHAARAYPTVETGTGRVAA